MEKGNTTILTVEEEKKLRQPIDEYVGNIQKKIDALRADGIDKVISLQNTLDGVKRDRSLTQGEKRTGSPPSAQRSRWQKAWRQRIKKKSPG